MQRSRAERRSARKFRPPCRPSSSSATTSCPTTPEQVLRLAALAVLGTLMLCTAPVDLTLARLAHRLGRSRPAQRHLADADRSYGPVAGFEHAFDSVRALLGS